MSLILIILALLWFLISGTTLGGASSEQSCVAEMSGTERCGPETTDGFYALPRAGVVIRSLVNNGPLSAEYQEGYEIEIDVSGVATITATHGEADPIVRTEVITVNDVQEILTNLEQCQFYYLPQLTEFDDAVLPIGGSVSILELHLRNGDWEVSGATLTGQDLTSFDSCQSDLAHRFDLEQPNLPGASFTAQ